MSGTRYRIRTGVNAVKGHYPGPLDEPSKKRETTVAGPSAPKRRRYPGDVVSKNEFVSSCASLIRNHFALYTLGLEVRSTSRYLVFGSSA